MKYNAMCTTLEYPHDLFVVELIGGAGCAETLQTTPFDDISTQAFSITEHSLRHASGIYRSHVHVQFHINAAEKHVCILPVGNRPHPAPANALQTPQPINPASYHLGQRRATLW